MSAKILKELERGAPIEAAAPLAGIGRRTFYDWMYRGAQALAAEEAGKEVPDEEKPFAEFYTAVEQVRSEWETRQLEGIEEAGKTGPQYWTARAWLLERRMPEKYALKARVDHRHELQVEIGHSRPEDVVWKLEGSDGDRALPPTALDEGNGSQTGGAPLLPGASPSTSPPKRRGEDQDVFGPLVWDHPKSGG